MCSLPASRRSGSALSKRDEFLKRDRQLSLRTPIPGSAPSLRSEFNPTTKVPQGPRRPRLSFFRCDCQTARGRSPSKPNLNFEAIRRGSLSPSSKLAPRLPRGKNNRKTSHPASLSREEPVRKIPVTRMFSRRETRQTVGRAAYRPVRILCQRTFTKKFSVVETSAPRRRLTCIFKPPQNRKVTRTRRQNR